MSYTLVDLNWIRRDSDDLLFSKSDFIYQDYVNWCDAGSVPSLEDANRYEMFQSSYKSKLCWFVKINSATLPEYSENLRINLNRKKGELIRTLCYSVINYVTGKNEESSMTSEEIDQFILNYGDILQLLSANRHNSAKALIVQIVPDQFVSQEDKDNVLKIYNTYETKINEI